MKTNRKVSSFCRCSCGECTPMPTERESLCCREIPEVENRREEMVDIPCITHHEGFQPVCLNVHVLLVAYLQFRQQFGERVGHAINEWVHISTTDALGMWIVISNSNWTCYYLGADSVDSRHSRGGARICLMGRGPMGGHQLAMAVAGRVPLPLVGKEWRFCQGARPLGKFKTRKLGLNDTCSRSPYFFSIITLFLFISVFNHFSLDMLFLTGIYLVSSPFMFTKVTVWKVSLYSNNSCFSILYILTCPFLLFVSADNIDILPTGSLWDGVGGTWGDMSESCYHLALFDE